MHTHMLSAVLAAAFALLMPATAAQAQALRTYVSQTGSDANNCTLTSPCRSFDRAQEETVAAGQISCLDSGSFTSGGTTISKTLTIDCAGMAATSALIVVNGAGIVVKIRNLRLLFAASGIDFQNGAALFVENSTISHMTTGNPDLAIRFRPSAPGSQLVVTDTIIDSNGALPSTGGGIQVAPQAGGSAGVVLNRVHLGFNVTAMVLNSTSGGIGAVMRDSVVSSSRSNGVLAIAGAAPVNLKIERSSLVNNVGNAIQSLGANSVVRIGGSEITGNQTGLSADNGGQILSYQNNEINGNGTDGVPTGVLAVQ